MTAFPGFALAIFLLSFTGCTRDPVLDNPGLHVLSGFADTHAYLTPNPSEDEIRRAIAPLDWEGGFHQVFLVKSPGKAIEVGGSLDPEHGLSSVYRDNAHEIYRVTREPPTTVAEMEAILLSFHRGDGLWETMFIYDLIPYDD